MKGIIIGISIAIVIGVALFFIIGYVMQKETTYYQEPLKTGEVKKEGESASSSAPFSIEGDPLPPVAKPKEVRAIYITAWVALTPSRIEKLITLAKESDINAFVINYKDGEQTHHTPKMRAVLEKIRLAGIYPIARLVAFQDTELAKKNPEVALKNLDGSLWKDKHYYWVDPANKQVLANNIQAGIDAIDLGFEEVNFDYFRFPSDTSLESVLYPTYVTSTLKEDVIQNAARVIVGGIKKERPWAIVSVDVFGYIFLNDDDQGIGQRVVKFGPEFDIIAPMIYPSHYKTGNFGYKNPAEHPYEVMFQTLQRGLELFQKASTTVVIRPWIQAFNMGAVYTPDMIKKQMQAIKDIGLSDGWLAWNAANNYETSAYQETP